MTVKWEVFNAHPEQSDESGENEYESETSFSDDSRRNDFRKNIIKVKIILL